MKPEIARAIDAVLLAGQEQRAWLSRNPHPPLYASLPEAVAFYGGPRAALSLWSMVRAVELLRTAVDHGDEVAAVPQPTETRQISDAGIPVTEGNQGVEGVCPNGEAGA